MKNLYSIFLKYIFKHKYFIFLIFLLLCMSFVLYKKYIFGGKLFLFEDFGSDSVRVSLPTYTYLFDWFRSGMLIWSDKMGIGTSILSHSDIILDPFTYILFLLGRNGIIYMFVHMVIIKIILSGIFFWMLIGKYKLSPYAKLLGSVTYAFGGYMIVVGQNYVFSTIYVYLPLILLGFEIWLQSKKSWLLILMLTLTALYFYYFFYMTAIFFCIYALFRYFTFYNFNFKNFILFVFSLAKYQLIALGLSAFYWLPSLALTLNNLRVASPAPSFETLFIFDPSMILTVFTRFLGYDALGSPMNYLGYGGDYFQLPLYCGIITTLLVPQVLLILKGKEKFLYRIFFIVLAIVLFTPFFSYALNGFSAITYRWIYFIFFSLALFLSIAADSIYEKMRVNLRALYITAIALVTISFIAIIYNVPIKNFSLYSLYTNSSIIWKYLFINMRVFLKDYILISSYVLLTVLFFHTQRWKYIIKIMIIILTCIELIWFPMRFINDRLTTSPDPVKNQLGYFDNTNSAVAFLNKTDSTFYRVDKSYDSVISEYGVIPSDNEAMVQGYRGLKSYNGNNQPNYIRFLQYSGIFVIYPNPKFPPPKGARPQDIVGPNLNYINGVGNRYLLQSFLGVKYFLAKEDSNIEFPKYYRYFTTVNDIKIYKNNYYLPLGFTFDSFITHDEFMILNNSMRDLALLSFVVVDNENELSGILSKGNIGALSFINTDENIGDLIGKRMEDNFKIISYKDNDIIGQINTSRNKILVLTIPYDKDWFVYINGQEAKSIRVDGGLIGVKLSSGKYAIEIKYIPQKMILGIIITIITVLLLALFKRNRRIRVKIPSKIKIQADSCRKQVIKIAEILTRLVMNILNKCENYLSLVSSSVDKIIFKPLFKKYSFYIAVISGIIVFILTGLITRGYSFYNLFQSNRKDYFMDFFNPLSELIYGPYAHGSIYPPLPQLLYKIVLRFIPHDIVENGAFAIRSSQAGQIAFIFYLLITLVVFFALLMEIKKGSRMEKYFFIFITLFSAPFLFQFERANIIFVALLFSMIFVFFKNSKNRVVREFALISLAISAGIKIYPALFGLLLIREKRFGETARASIYCIVAFILPVFGIGGMNQLFVLIGNYFHTSIEILKWGVGYSVNVQNTVRIIFAFFGDYGNRPISIGNFISWIILYLGILSVLFLRSKWRSVALLSLLMILVPSISYEYVLIYMLIPLILFLDSQEKLTKINCLYLICFILIFVPFNFGNINALNSKFGLDARPLSYGVFIQNVAILIMALSLTIQGFIDKLRKYTATKKVKNGEASHHKKIVY
jgi:hypothetical protein